MGYRNNLTLIFGLVLLVGLVLAGALAFWFLRPVGPETSASVLLEQGQPAQPFQLLTAQGEPAALEQFRGRPVIVHFWSLRCGPCKDALADLQEIYPQYAREGLALLAVNHKGVQSEVGELGSSLGVTYSLLLDGSGEVTGQYGVSTFPTTYFIDPQGSIRHVEVGRMEKEKIVEYIQEMLVIVEPTATTEPEETATSAPSATPPPLSAELEGCVTTSILNGRLGPGKEHAVVRGFRRDECWSFDGRSPDSGWLRLASATAEDGSPLWVSAEFIDLKGELSDLPVIE